MNNPASAGFFFVLSIYIPPNFRKIPPDFRPNLPDIPFDLYGLSEKNTFRPNSD